MDCEIFHVIVPANEWVIFSRPLQAKKNPTFSKIRKAVNTPLPDAIRRRRFQMWNHVEASKRFVPSSEPQKAGPDSEMLRPLEMPQGTAISLLGVDYLRLKT